jgi:hypothetical protein
VVSLTLAALIVLGGRTAPAAEVRTAGKLSIPAGAPVLAVSTDPVVQYVLGQDLGVARRRPGALSTTPVTVTVTLNQRMLKPGVTLRDLGPDPAQVAMLLRQMGIEPPPLGDTDSRPADPYAATVRHGVLQPDDPMQAFRDYQAMNQALKNSGGPQFGPNGTATDKDIYDTVIVARATLSGSPDTLTAVTLIHPGDNVRTAKELIAEEVANALLH